MIFSTIDADKLIFRFSINKNIFFYQVYKYNPLCE